MATDADIGRALELLADRDIQRALDDIRDLAFYEWKDRCRLEYEAEHDRLLSVTAVTTEIEHYIKAGTFPTQNEMSQWARRLRSIAEDTKTNA